ncbi:MAG: PAS domain S-box protein [Actinomycetota bacterium]
MIFHALADSYLLDHVADAILSDAPDGIVVVDGGGFIVLVNSQAAELFGYEGSDLLGRSVEDLVPSEQRERHTQDRDAFVHEPANRPMRGYGGLCALRKDGAEVPVEISLSAIANASQPLYLAMVRDVSNRLRAEARVEATDRELQITTERERIARDLHDTIIQELFATGMALQAVVSRVDDDVVSKRIMQSIDALDDSIRRIRTVIFGLSAHSAWGRGLRGEILKVAKDEAPALGFEPAVSFAGTVDALDEPYASHVVGVVREAISNTARHARSSAASIEVVVDDELSVVVADNGIGFPDSVMEGNGLTNLRKRAEELGGKLEIEHREGEGTVVELRSPID